MMYQKLKIFLKKMLCSHGSIYVYCESLNNTSGPILFSNNFIIEVDEGEPQPPCPHLARSLFKARDPANPAKHSNLHCRICCLFIFLIVS